MQGEKGHALVGNSFWENSECTVLISGPVFVYGFVVHATYLRAWPRWGCGYHISWWWCQWNAEWTDDVPEVSCSSGTQAWGERNCVSNPAARWLRSSPSNAQTPCRRGNNMQPWGTKWLILKQTKKQTVWFEFKDPIRPKYRYIQETTPQGITVIGSYLTLFTFYITKSLAKEKRKVLLCSYLNQQIKQSTTVTFFRHNKWYVYGSVSFFLMIFKDKIQMCPWDHESRKII